VAINSRRRAGPPDMNLLAQVSPMPKLAALKVVAVEPVGSVRSDHPLAVAHRRIRTVGVGLVRRLFLAGDDPFLPEQVAAGAVKAYQSAAVADGLRDEDAAFGNDRRRVASLGERRAPAEVF